MSKPSLLLIVFITCSLTACNFGKPSQQHYQQQLFTFGTLVDISLLADNPEQAQKTINLIRTKFDQLHLDWHPWGNGSLARVNQQLKTTRPVAASASVVSLIQQSRLLSEKTNGLFNPAIGQLIKIWQFDQIEDENHLFKRPDPLQLQYLLKQNPKMQDIIIHSKADHTEIQTNNPAVSLDFGAFAKGVAIEKMIQIMKQNQVNNGLINAGGDLKVIGLKNNRPWRIGIKNPSYKQHPEQPKILASIELQDNEALFTSGDYERFFEFEGKKYHHIIDPRNGFPATGTRSVTVLTKNAGLADAASTALFIAGIDQWQSIAAKMDIDYVMLVTTDNQVYLSPAMAERIQLLVENQPIILNHRE